MSHPGATATDRHRVVIIGSGFGGLNAAKALKHADVDIKMIARTTHHLFQPLLYQVATGIISSGEIAPPTRIILRKQKNVQVLLGNVTHIDLASKTIKSELLGHTYVTPYDSLIIAAGAGLYFLFAPSPHGYLELLVALPICCLGLFLLSLVLLLRPKPVSLSIQVLGWFVLSISFTPVVALCLFMLGVALGR